MPTPADGMAVTTPQLLAPHILRGVAGDAGPVLVREEIVPVRGTNGRIKISEKSLILHGDGAIRDHGPALRNTDMAQKRKNAENFLVNLPVSAKGKDLDLLKTMRREILAIAFG